MSKKKQYGPRPTEPIRVYNALKYAAEKLEVVAVVTVSREAIVTNSLVVQNKQTFTLIFSL